MKPRSYFGGLVSPRVAIFAVCCFVGQRAAGQTYNTWTGSGNWSNTGNWNNGGVGNYGQLQFQGSGSATSNNDVGSVSQWRLYFSGTQAYTLTNGTLNLFDFGGAHSWVLSDSTVTQTISTLQVNFAATAGATYGQISARNTGDLSLNNVGITGSQVSQLRIAGESSGKVIINGVLSGSGKSVVVGLTETATAATTTDVVFNGTNTYSGDTFIVAGSLSFGSGGTSNNSTIRLGETSGSNDATIKLTSTTGGQTIGSLLNARSGSSGILALSSLNTSNTNTWSGNIALDHNLGVSQTAGGTLALSGSTIDIKAQTLSVNGAGNVNITGTISNSTGSGQLVVGTNGTAGGPTVTLSQANTYSGQTFVRAGSLAFTSSGSVANSTIRLGSTSGTSVDANINLSTAAGGTTISSTINSVTTSGSGALAINSQNTSGSNTLSGHVALDRSLAITQSAGGTLNLTQAHTTADTSNLLGTDIKGNTLTLTAASGGNIVFSGATGTSANIYNSTGSGNVTVNGAGTVTFSGNNTYGGTTTVSNGKLLVNATNSGTGAVNVSSSGTLGGTGSVAGTVNVTGVLAPGASIESLGTGAVNFISGSTFAYELNSTSLNGDLVDSTGVLDIASGSILTLTDLAAGTLTLGSKLTLIDYMGGWTSGELFTYNGNTLADDSTITIGSNSWLFNYNDVAGGTNFLTDQVGATSFVTMTVVPEPSSALLGLLGTSALLLRRRRAA